MKTRPWPLVLLALFQILSPIGSVLANAWALGVKPGYVLAWILQRSPVQIFETLALMPVAGLAIYWMKGWSYAVFFAAMGWSLYRNVTHWNYASQYFSIITIALFYGLQIGLALYFMIPSVRRTYMDPRVRWWEAKKRYVLESPVTLEVGGVPFHGRFLNISEGGLFAELDKRLSEGLEVLVRFSLLSVEYEVKGSVVYCVPRPHAGYAHGIRFEHTRPTAARFRQLAKGLELIGIADRDQNTKLPWHASIRNWFLGVAKTGKGLVPEYKAEKKA